jgi:hypothetical protein
MRGRRLWGVIVAIVGVVAIIGSFVWRSVAVPALVRFPTDLDVSPAYEGTLTVYINPTTNLPVASPKPVPLVVRRHLVADGKASSKDLVVITETLDLEATGLFKAQQQNQYVMDRRTMKNVADRRAYAFTPDNVVDRSGAYRLAFPFDTKSQVYPVYKNEIAASYQAKGTGPGQKAGGLSTIGFAADNPAKPVTPAYLTALDQAVKLPRSLTLTQLKPILRTAGFDLDVQLPVLLSKLSKADVQALVAVAQKPVALQYQLAFKGNDLIEPYTGSIVNVPLVEETLSAVPSGDSVATLQRVLAKYPNVPEAQAGLGAVKTLAAQPIKVFVNNYHQTEASVTDVAKEVKDQRDRRRLAESFIPNAMLIVGIVLALIGILLAALPRRQPRTETSTDASPATPPTPS